MNKQNKILIAVFLVICIGLYNCLDAIFFAPKRFVIREVTIEDTKIPEQLDDMRVLFFSDLNYGTNMNKERLNSLISKINSLDADVIIFGGDLFDDIAECNEESKKVLIDGFSSIEADYGKYAIYGDFDELSEERINTINQIYSSSDFEIIKNNSINIHKQGSDSITLVGLDNGVNGQQNIEQAYSMVSRNSYVITVCHTPDTIDTVPLDLTNYFLAGHSLGGQIYYYFGASYQPPMAQKYFRGIHTVQNTTLDISSGVGTHDRDIRFFSNSEIVLYTLKNKESKPTPTPSVETNTQDSSSSN